MTNKKISLSRDEFAKRNRRSFLFAGVGLVLGALGLDWILVIEEEDGEVPHLLRQGFLANEGLWKRLSSPEKLNSATPSPPDQTPARVNGDIGLEEDADLTNWSLKYESPTVQKSLSLKDLQTMPRASSHSEFRCIEGWSMPISYQGIKFSDFLNAIDPNAKNFPYVGLETPEGTYYVSIDMPSMLHEQTMLADKMNGEPLGSDHGEPLRLIIPLKYGIKNLKRIGRIFVATERPRDYWAENGYDWYSGF